jgi:pimeloyl-ACP methyl ester carboxylesterase
MLHAQKFVEDGFAVLRYDPPGIGKSSGVYENASLEKRVQEVHAAVSYLLSRSDILPKRIGLWGASQGCWVITMTAANYPTEIAFIISVSGAAVSPAEQQVYSVISQSKSLGMSEENITKATIFAHLLIDMSLQEQKVYEQINRADATSLGEGPWNTFMQLVYNSENMDPNQKLQQIIAVLESVQDEGWTTYLYLKNMYIPALRSITPEQLVEQSQSSGESMLTEPKDFLTKVTCPVLAIWGEKDPLMSAQQSAELFEKYLTEAGNDDIKLIIFPNADHSINGFITAYWETISNWLNSLYVK